MGNKISIRSSTHKERRLQIQKKDTSISSIKSHNKRVIHKFHTASKCQQRTKPTSQQDFLQLGDVSIQGPHMVKEPTEIPDEAKEKHENKEVTYKRITDLEMYRELGKLDATDDVISCYVVSVKSKDVFIPDSSVEVRQILREEIAANEVQTGPASGNDSLLSTISRVDNFSVKEDTIKTMTLKKNEDKSSKSEVNITKRTANDSKNEDKNGKVTSCDRFRERYDLAPRKEEFRTTEKLSKDRLVNTEKLNENNQIVSNKACVSSQQIMQISTEPTVAVENDDNADDGTSAEDRVNRDKVRDRENEDESSVYQFPQNVNTDLQYDKPTFRISHDSIHDNNLLLQQTSSRTEENVLEDSDKKNDCEKDLMISHITTGKLSDEVVNECEVINVTETENDFCSLQCQL